MSGPAAPRDEQLVAYVEAIEGSLRTLRGSETVLSPRDFALVRGWHDSGVPLAAVLVAIDAAFAADPRLAGLASLRRRVEELAPRGPRADGLPARETEHASLPELAERLTELHDRLLELPGRAAARPLVEVDELADLVAVASRPNWEYLRKRLREIDELVSEAALDALPAEQAVALRAEAERAAARHRGRVDDAALAAAVTRLLQQRAREALRLPRVGLG